MEITFIGVVVIILSIIAFLKNEDWLLGLTMFFSTFTAASALNIYPTTTAIVPFEIPLVLWIIKQFIDIIKDIKNIKKENIKNLIKQNKIFTSLLIFTVAMVISEIWLLISGINYHFYDTLYLEDKMIAFSVSNITQIARVICFLVFVMLLSIKMKSKEKIKQLLNIFVCSTTFAVLWGCLQFLFHYLNIKYPDYLFNNNPWYMQGIDQVMHGIKRINSIGTEPSVFALNLLAALPIILIPCLYKKDGEKHYLQIINDIVLVFSIVCAILTTSTTALIGLVVLIGTLLIYLNIKYFKENKNPKYKKRIIKLIIYSIISIIIALVLALYGNKLTKDSYIEQNSSIIKENENYFNEPENIISNNTITNNNEPENNTTNNTTNNVEQENIISNNTITNNNELENIVLNNTIVQNEEIIQIKDTIEYLDFFNAIKEMTISKLSSGSGQQRFERELLGLEIYSISPIFGVGFGSFRTFILFTNVLVNIGVLGLISLFYLLYIVFEKLIINRKKDENYFLIFIFSIIGMLVAFSISIPDLIYIYFWIILVLAYNYFNIEVKEQKMKKQDLVIGIDARGLNNKKTGIATYIEEVVKKINCEKNTNTKYILYSNRDININVDLNENIVLKNYNKPAGTLWVYFCLPKILEQDNVDVFWGTQHLLPRRNRYTKSIKYILTVHDLAIHKLGNIGEWKNTLIQRLFLKRSCKNANKIMADSKATQNDIVEIFSIDEKKIQVVYLGTNFSDKYDLSKEEENNILKKFSIKDKNYLFFVSTIEPRKNIITLIKAFELLKQKQENKTLKLILAGGLGWKYQEIINAIENSRYKEDINLAGYISKEEKECLLKNAKCFVYPSLYEGFGLPILEAMAKEAIVVTSNISSIPEVAENAAIYFDNIYDHIELSEKIEEAMLINESERNKYINLGKKQVNKFTWEKCTAEILDVLR